MTKHTIICLSSQCWDDAMWTNKQHVMMRLSRLHRVIHVDFGLRPFPVYLIRRMKRRPTDLLRPWRLLVDGVSKIHESLYVCDSYNSLSIGLLPLDSARRDAATFAAKLRFLKRFLKHEIHEDPIVWVYHPGYADVVDQLPRKLLVYDCVDNYEAFPAYTKNKDWIRSRDRAMCEKADLVVTSSRPLYEEKRPFNPAKTHLVHNVGDARHFGQADNERLEIPVELRHLDGPLIGFVGAVSSYKLNADWLIRLAEQHPDWHVVLIGPIGRADRATDVSNLKALPNVHLLGYRPYTVLPNYVKRFDVAVIPYRINDYTRFVFPIKFFEFLASGTPVVVSNLPSLHEFHDIVRVAHDADSFVDACEQALTDIDDAARAKRVRLAEQNTWSHRVSKIMDLVEIELSGKQQCRLLGEHSGKSD